MEKRRRKTENPCDDFHRRIIPRHWSNKLTVSQYSCQFTIEPLKLSARELIRDVRESTHFECQLRNLTTLQIHESISLSSGQSKCNQKG